MHETHLNLEQLKKYFVNDAFAEMCGIELTEVGQGFAKTRLTVKKQHLNSLGIAHGGIIFTLADMAFAAAAHTWGKSAVAINTNISFIKAGKTETLYAEAREVSRNRKLATYSVQVTDASNTVLALFQGTVYIRTESIH